MADSPIAKAAPKRPGMNKEQQILAAVLDKRLRGHEEAIYFMLRGLGMPVTDPPTEKKGESEVSGANERLPKHEIMPRIEVSATRQPTLFAALKRLGMKADGKVMIIEPRSDASAATAKSVDGDSAGLKTQSPQRPLRVGPPDTLLDGDDQAGSRSLHQHSVSSPSTRSKDCRLVHAPYRVPASMPKLPTGDIDALFARLQLPKHAQSRTHILGAVEQCAFEAREAAEAEKQLSRRVVRASPPEQVPDEHVGALQGATEEEPQDLPDWWRMRSSSMPSRSEQLKSMAHLSKPKRQNTYFPPHAATIIGPFATRQPPKMTRFGAVSHKSLCARLDDVKAMGGFPWKRLPGDERVGYAHFEQSPWTGGAEDFLNEQSLDRDSALPKVDWGVFEGERLATTHGTEGFSAEADVFENGNLTALMFGHRQGEFAQPHVGAKSRAAELSPLAQTSQVVPRLRMRAGSCPQLLSPI